MEIFQYFGGETVTGSYELSKMGFSTSSQRTPYIFSAARQVQWTFVWLSSRTQKARTGQLAPKVMEKKKGAVRLESACFPKFVWPKNA